MKQAFATWSLDGAQRWLENLGLVMEIEESTGKYFPESGSAREVRDVILHGCLDRGVKVRYESSVVGLRRQCPGHTGGEDAVQCGWVCELADGEEVTADRVILAMGGTKPMQSMIAMLIRLGGPKIAATSTKRKQKERDLV